MDGGRPDGGGSTGTESQSGAATHERRFGAAVFRRYDGGGPKRGADLVLLARVSLRHLSRSVARERYATPCGNHVLDSGRRAAVCARRPDTRLDYDAAELGTEGNHCPGRRSAFVCRTNGSAEAAVR